MSPKPLTTALWGGAAAGRQIWQRDLRRLDSASGLGRR